MSMLKPHKEIISSFIKRGIYQQRRFPWGGTKGADGKPVNAYGISASHQNFFTSANASVQVLQRNEDRRFIQIQNMSAASDIVFQWGGTASATDGVTLTPGQVEIFDVACPVDSLNIFCAVAGQRVAIVEGF